MPNICVIFIVRRTLRTIVMKLVQVFLAYALCHSDFNYVLSTDVKITGTANCSLF
jgi:hypothetical protein